MKVNIGVAGMIVKNATVIVIVPSVSNASERVAR